MRWTVVLFWIGFLVVMMTFIGGLCALLVYDSRNAWENSVRERTGASGLTDTACSVCDALAPHRRATDPFECKNCGFDTTKAYDARTKTLLSNLKGLKSAASQVAQARYLFEIIGARSMRVERDAREAEQALVVAVEMAEPYLDVSTHELLDDASDDIVESVEMRIERLESALGERMATLREELAGRL